MVLTKQRRLSHDDDRFPTAQLSLLAICRLAEPIALTSVFPYAFKLVKDFHACDDSNASLYAGLFISAFALAESLTGMFWGGLSDQVGRKPVLLFGCAGTLISLLVVGFSRNIWMAVLGRALGGLLNGNIGVIQTMVGELVKKPEHEPRAYAVMPFIWSVGTIIGPAIGGTFADPSTAFPARFSRSGLFGVFPYLLPNVICAAMLLVSIGLGYYFLEETHPEKRGCPSAYVDETAETPLLVTVGATEDCDVGLQAGSYATFQATEIATSEQWVVHADGSSPPSRTVPLTQKTFTKRIMMLIIALGIFTYHSMTYDHLLPIFLQDDRKMVVTVLGSPLAVPGGLGLSLQSVGLVMSVNGLIALLIQAIVFPACAGWLGVWRVFMLTSILHPLAYFIVPYLALLPPNWLYPGIYAALSIRNVLSILAYPVILILLKDATPSPSVLGKVNGMAASAGAACRTVAPPIAGYLYSIGARQGFTGLAWWGSGLIAVLGAIQCWCIEREKRRAGSVLCETDSLAGDLDDLDTHKTEGALVVAMEG
ncbi:MAG: hypothetical protein M1838_005112 [Thelocarpon superellum]|nr:MAG: hypothetical protein M1838_005112 [Thelocarpon superellum]